MNCLFCQNEILKKGKKYCSRKCWLSSEEYYEMRNSKKSEIYKKASMSLKGRVIPEHQRKAVSESRKKIKGILHPRWNHDRIEQLRKQKLSRLVYGLVGRTLEYSRLRKTDHGENLLGYTRNELRAHLEKLFKPGMTWENHGKGSGKWHVDHVKPVSDFPVGTPISEINALENLRPLWEHENLSLGGHQANRLMKIRAITYT